MNASGTCALILVPLFCKPRCRVSLMEDNGLERMRGELTAIFTGRIPAMGIHRPKSPTLSPDAPVRWAIQRPGTIVVTPILSGLHDRYARI
jgi:hypothetical protein